MLLTEKYINDLTHIYQGGRRVAFYDHIKLIPALEPGLKDEIFICTEDKKDEFGNEHKKGKHLVELYIYISNPNDKYSIHKAKVKKVKIEGFGKKWETEVYKDAYEKYLKFKKDGVKTNIEDSLLEKENEELRKKVAEMQKSAKEVVKSANSEEPEKKVDNDTSDDSTEHSA